MEGCYRVRAGRRRRGLYSFALAPLAASVPRDDGPKSNALAESRPDLEGLGIRPERAEQVDARERSNFLFGQHARSPASHVGECLMLLVLVRLVVQDRIVVMDDEP
jgi:hypothetical protein